jgi:hypothetical protein|tara:strand:+ start:939 stop:1079 length:141 start_codon:yes stop_codon:yes gene_type:complete
MENINLLGCKKFGLVGFVSAIDIIVFMLNGNGDKKRGPLWGPLGGV